MQTLQSIASNSSLSKAPVNWVLTCLALTMLLSSLGTSIANIALPTLINVFDASFQQVQWVVLAYLLALTASVINMGRLGDLMGRRKLLMAGVAVFVIASLACGSVLSLWELIFGRVIQGIGAAIMMALTMALASSIAPKEQTGRIMGLLGTMSAIGTALGPSLGGLLIEAFGWRSIFFVNIPLGFTALILAWRYLPADKPVDKARPHFDYPGTVLLIITLSSFALAMTLVRGHFGLLNLALLAAAGMGLKFFLIVETRAASPLINLEIFHNPILNSGFIASATVATVVMTTLVVGPFYLSDALALSSVSVGLVMSCGPLVSALAGLPAGHLVDRFGAQVLSLAGLCGMLVGVATLAWVPASFGVAGYLLPLIVTTASYATFQVANNTSIMMSVGNEHRGLASGVLNLSRNLGLISGASLMGAIYSFASGSATNPTISQAAQSGMHISFAVASMLVMGAIGLVFRVKISGLTQA